MAHRNIDLFYSYAQHLNGKEPQDLNQMAKSVLYKLHL